MLLPADEGVGHGAGDRAAEIGVLSQSGVSSSMCLTRLMVKPEGGEGGQEFRKRIFCLSLEFPLPPSLPPSFSPPLYQL